MSHTIYCYRLRKGSFKLNINDTDQNAIVLYYSTDRLHNVTVMLFQYYITRMIK